MSDTKGIHKAIVQVMRGLAKVGIAKEKRNTQQGFNFRGIEQVYAALAPLLVEHGVTITPHVEDRIDGERKTNRGGSLYTVALRVRFVLACAEDGSATECSVWGEGMDSGDKATNKALSAAYKYMAFMTFCIPVEGMVDGDADSHEPSQSRVSKSQPAPQRTESKPEPFKDPEEADRVMGNCVTEDELTRWWYRVVASKFPEEERKALAESAGQHKAKLQEAG